MTESTPLLLWCEAAPADEPCAKALWQHLDPSCAALAVAKAPRLVDADVVLLLVSVDLHPHLQHDDRRAHLANRVRAGALLIQIKVRPVSEDALFDKGLQVLPRPPLPCVHHHGTDPEAVWVEIIDELRSALRRHRQARAASLGEPQPPASDGRLELFVHLQRQGKDLTVQYFSAHQALCEPVRVPCPTLTSAPLFSLLFPKGAPWPAVLQQLYGEHEPPQPSFKPVRLRVQTDDAELAALPWHQLERELPLCATPTHWTCEVSPARATATAIVHLPGPLLCFAPDGADDEAARAGAAVLAAALPRGADLRCRVVRDLDQLRAALREPTSLVHVLCTGDDAGLRCGAHQIPWAALVDALHAQPLVYLQVRSAPAALVQQVLRRSAATGPAGAHLTLIARGAEDPDLFARFLAELLHERREPVAALYRAALKTVVDPERPLPADAVPLLITRGQLRVFAPALRPRDEFAPLRLDRDTPRALVQRHLRDLLQSRRVEALVAYAEAGNHLERFFDQALEEVLDNGAIHFPVHLRLPPQKPIQSGKADTAARALRGQLLDLMRQHLGERGDEDLATLLRHPSITQSPTGPTVVWLDCGLHRTFDEVHLRGWLNFCLQLAEPGVCPEGMRVVVYLALERPGQRHAALAQDLDDLSAEGNERLNLSVLPPLPAVRLNDLRRFLLDHGKLRPDLVPDAASWIMLVTAGHYEKTVSVLRRALEVGWDPVLADLRREARRKMQP